MLRAIRYHYRELFAGDRPSAGSGPVGQPDEASPLWMVQHPEAHEWGDAPAQYLEKIFQIVLTLPPLETAGYHRMVSELLGVRADQVAPSRAEALGEAAGGLEAEAAWLPRADRVQESSAATSGTTVDLEPHDAVQAQTATSPTLVPGLRRVQRVDPLALTPDELRLMALLGPPLIISPRAVKRLANSYGVLAACRPRKPDGTRVELDPVDDHLDDQLDGHPDGRPDTGPTTGGDAREPTAYPYRAAMVLLAAVVGYPDVGPAFFPALHHAAAADPGGEWLPWLEGLQSEHRRDDRRPGQSSSRAAELLQILADITAAAAAADLPLPRRLATWAEWVIPVGRLSYPTGPAVTRLLPTAPGSGIGSGS